MAFLVIGKQGCGEGERGIKTINVMIKVMLGVDNVSSSGAGCS